MEKEPDWESMVLGRTQAVDFIGKLEGDWRKMAEQYREIGRESEARTYEECARERRWNTYPLPWPSI